MALRTTAMLRRWAAQFPNSRMPDSIDELPLGQRSQLQSADPQLHDLLANQANAELELQAMSGELADSYEAPSQEQVNTARVAEILAQNPGGSKGHYEGETYIEGTAPNLTLMAELAALDPQAYQAQELIRKPPAQAPDQQQIAAQRQAAAQQHADSMNHAASLAKRGL